MKNDFWHLSTFPSIVDTVEFTTYEERPKGAYGKQNLKDRLVQN